MRFARALKSAGLAFLIAGPTGCVAIQFAVRHSSDGQAGMAAPIGGVEAAVAAAVVTFVVSLARSKWRNSLSQRSKISKL
jgi:hypothetical protein